MTLQEAETKLSELNEKIGQLLKERETVLKEWNNAFNAENPENVICVDENIGGCYNLYLVNGDLRTQVCLFDIFDMKGSIEEFYKRIDVSMSIFNIANKRELSDYQKNLVYAKVTEIRESMKLEDPM